MKISPYMNINRIEFMVTYQCSGKCGHCSVGDKLNRTNGYNHVEVQEAINAVERLSQLFSVSSVMTFGGEPLLYADVVCAIHKKAKQCGIEARQLITNGYFSKDNEKRRFVAKELYESGVNNLLLSVDVFHQETIPVEMVYHFAQTALNAGIPNIRLHPAWVITEEHNNPYNAKTKEILKSFNDLAIPVSSGNNIFMAGNAALNLAKYYEKPHLDLTKTCGSMSYTEPLTNITSLSIVPNGNVMICGFTIGNIYKETIEEIVSRYNPYENEYMDAIILGGASSLIALAERNGISVDTAQCYSVCDLCHKINNQLSLFGSIL